MPCRAQQRMKQLHFNDKGHNYSIFFINHTKIQKEIVMTKPIDSTFIQIIHPVCCGLDVHKDKISACLITLDENGQEQYELRKGVEK